jgi:hypothetical protein
MGKKRTSKTRTRASSTGESQGLPDNFNPDYTYVIQDLRRIGLLAGIFLTILVLLAFFLG